MPTRSQPKQTADLMKELERRMQPHLQAAADELAKHSDDRDGDLIGAELEALHRLLDQMRAIVRVQRKSAPLMGAVVARKDRSDRQRAQYLTRKYQRAISRLEVIRDAPRQALYLEQQPKESLWTQQRLALDCVFDIFHAMSNPNEQAEDAVDLEHYPDIPLAASKFIGHCHAAFRLCLAQKKDAPLRFIDVGSGVGTTLLLASRLFPDRTGLEYDEGYVAAAEALQKRAGPYGSRIIQGDALTYDDYDAYDVIYFYKPIKDLDKMKELEVRIQERAAPGTILVAPYADFQWRHDPDLCIHIDANLYVAGLDQDAADRLVEEALTIGTAMPDLVVRSTVQHAGLGAVMRACRANGMPI